MNSFVTFKPQRNQRYWRFGVVYFLEDGWRDVEDVTKEKAQTKEFSTRIGIERKEECDVSEGSIRVGVVSKSI